MGLKSVEETGIKCL